jgi:predicted ribosomally synthesized peptide with nif11-like leader
VQPYSLRDFLGLCQRDPALQQRLQGVGSLSEIVRIAGEAGFSLKTRDLQLWAHHEAFDEPWWPWAGSDPQARQQFFRQS